MSSIFHYTSNDGAMGIIDSSCLYATHYKYLNDPREMSITRDYIINSVTKSISCSIIEYAGTLRIGRDKLGFIGEKIKVMAADLTDGAFDLLQKHTVAYITSFCRHELDTPEWKNGLLSQWRGYGASGGCALEFNEASLKGRLEAEQLNYGFASLVIWDVFYKNHVDALDFEHFKEVGEALLRFANDPSPENDGRFNEALASVPAVIAVAAPFIKSPAFSEANEVRMAATIKRSEFAALKSGPKRRETRFRSQRGVPTPYVEMFKGSGNLPVKRIIVGPQHDQDRIVYALELAFEAKDMSVEISKSDISFLPRW